MRSEAKALKEKFEEQLSQTNAATDQRVNEAKSNMEHSLEVYKAELKEKSTKESRVRSESERRRISGNCCAERTFQSSETGFSSGYCEGGVEEIWQ